MRFTTVIALQIAMLTAALIFTQLPWYPVERGRGRPVLSRPRYGFQRLTWLPGAMLDLWLALNLGRIRVDEGLAWTCAGLGLALFAAGTTLGFAGWLALGTNRAPAATTTEAQTLVTHGVYGLVRHPAYLAVSLQYLGAALALQNWALLIGALANFAFWKQVADTEERLLVKHFGDAYRDYRKRVPQMIPSGSR